MAAYINDITPHSILTVAQQGEAGIERQFITRPEASIRPLASHLTRPSGYLDMLLTGKIMTSKQVRRIFGRADTHRSGYSGENSTISFSLGQVSWRYSGDQSKTSAKQYCGWGIVTSVDAILQSGTISISHCSSAGGVVNCTVRPDDLLLYFHRIRRDGEMDVHDGWGDFLELMLRHANDQQLIEFDLNLGRILIPQADKNDLLLKLQKRRTEYEKLAERLSRSSSDYVFIDEEDREFYYLQESLEFFTKVLNHPLDFEALPVAYYEHSNLQSAMRQLSLIS